MKKQYVVLSKIFRTSDDMEAKLNELYHHGYRVVAATSDSIIMELFATTVVVEATSKVEMNRYA
jgi:hypothetical protein